MSRILKGMVVSAAKLNLHDFDEKARAVVAEAQGRAEAIIARAGQEAEAIRLQARKEAEAAGRREGLEAGRVEGAAAGRVEALDELRSEGAATLEAVRKIVKELDSRGDVLTRSAEEDLLSFSVEVARKILLREVRDLPDGVVELVRKGVGLVGSRGEIVVELAPEDLALLAEIDPQMTFLAGAEARVSMVGVEGMSRGGCRVRAKGSDVDLTVEKQLERIESVLMGEAEE